MKDKGDYPMVKQSWYPHMMPKDVHLWEKFLRANAGLFQSVDYDYSLDQTPAWLDTEKDAFARSQANLYAKKIDVVGYTEDAIYLIEIKPYAGASALGQVKTYKHLYDLQEQPTKETRPAIITNQAQNGYCEILNSMGVTCWQVGICPGCVPYEKR